MSTDDVIDDVMNVICTDKDGKVIENIEVNKNNPLLIEKVNIPKKERSKPTTDKPGDTSKDQSGQ